MDSTAHYLNIFYTLKKERIEKPLKHVQDICIKYQLTEHRIRLGRPSLLKYAPHGSKRGPSIRPSAEVPNLGHFILINRFKINNVGYLNSCDYDPGSI